MLAHLKVLLVYSKCSAEVDEGHSDAMEAGASIPDEEYWIGCDAPLVSELDIQRGEVVEGGVSHCLNDLDPAIQNTVEGVVPARDILAADVAAD